MQKISLGKRVLRNKAFPLLVILIAMAIITMIFSSGVLNGKGFSSLFVAGFMASGNLLNVFYSLVIQCIILCGLAVILMGGSIDLSVSGQAALGSMVFALICSLTNMPWGFALLISLVLGACFGLINTFLVNVLRFPAFIATIGMASIYTGICNVLTQGNIVQIGRPGVVAITQARLFGNRLPVTFLISIALIIIYQLMLSRTRFGRSVFMAGGNAQAARLSGLNPNRIRLILFINNGVLATFGGIIYSAQIKQAGPSNLVAMAPDMRVIAAAVLGGVSFMGGTGNLGGPLVALLLINVFNNMLTVLKAPTYWTIFAQGFLLVVALIIDFVREERRRLALLTGAK